MNVRFSAQHRVFAMCSQHLIPVPIHFHVPLNIHQPIFFLFFVYQAKKKSDSVNLAKMNAKKNKNHRNVKKKIVQKTKASHIQLNYSVEQPFSVI